MFEEYKDRLAKNRFIWLANAQLQTSPRPFYKLLEMQRILNNQFLGMVIDEVLHICNSNCSLLMFA